MNPLDASTEALLRERLAASERLLETALAGQRDLGRLLEEQAAQHREVLEQNRRLQTELERLTRLADGLQVQLAELLRAQADGGRAPHA